MTREELKRLTEIRDGFKAAYWDFDKWRWAAKFDQFIRDAEHELAEGDAAEDSGPSTARGKANPITDRIAKDEEGR